jgi:hypothetical protein
MNPKNHENSIHELSVFEFRVKLMAGSCHCDIAIEFHKPISQIFMANCICLKSLVHDACFIFIKEEENEL